MFKTLILFFIYIFIAQICLSQVSGNAVKLETVWQFESENLSENKIVLSDEGIIVSLLDNRYILLDTGSGEVLWTIEVSGEIITEPVVNEGYFYIGTSLPNGTKALKKFSLKTGILIDSETKVKNSPEFMTQSNNASDNVQKFTTKNNIIEKYIQNKLIWKTKVGGNINDILINKNGVLISSSDNYLYQLNSKNGNKIWKIRFNNKVLGTNLLNENVGIASIYSENKVQIFDIQKGKIIGSFLPEKNQFLVNKPLTDKNIIYLQTNIGVICLKLKK